MHPDDASSLNLCRNVGMLGNKLLIIGSPGAGKTFFSKALHKHMKIPLYHLDDLYWKERWIRTSPQEWTETLTQVCSESKWIIDGNYFNSLSLRLKFADSVIFIDLSTTLCLYRTFKRAIKRLLGHKDSLPVRVREDVSYVPKLEFSWHFLFLILFFKLKTKPQILKLLGQRKDIYYKKIKSTKELKNIIAQFAKQEEFSC